MDVLFPPERKKAFQQYNDKQAKLLARQGHKNCLLCLKVVGRVLSLRALSSMIKAPMSEDVLLYFLLIL